MSVILHLVAIYQFWTNSMKNAAARVVVNFEHCLRISFRKSGILKVYHNKWRQHNFILLQYKSIGDSRDTPNYRLIILYSVPSKMFTSILFQSMHPHLISVNRFHSQPFHNRLHPLPSVLAQRKEFCNALFEALVDLKGGFGSLHRTALWLLLKCIGILTLNTYACTLISWKICIQPTLAVFVRWARCPILSQQHLAFARMHCRFTA